MNPNDSRSKDGPERQAARSPRCAPEHLQPRVARMTCRTASTAFLVAALLTAEGTSVGLGQPFHRVLWNGRFLSTNEWDRVAQMGFTLVHSDGGHIPTFLYMLEEAHRRGIKMIAGAPQPHAFPWLTIQVDASAPGAPGEFWPHVVHHYSQSEPALIFYGDGLPGLGEGLSFALGEPQNDTLGELAARINVLGHGVAATVVPGKEEMPSRLLATGWYGNAAVAPVTLHGGEIGFFDGARWEPGEAQYRRYVRSVKDHPGLYCLAPFDDTDIGPYSPAFQRHIRDKLRIWAPRVPVYLLVSDLGRSGGSFEHDHKIAPEAFDGFVLYSYPHDWEGSGTWRDVNSLRALLQEWTRTPRSGLSKEVIHLVAAFAQADSPWSLPPEHALRMEWDALARSDVPLAGFGYYAWDGHSTTLGNSEFLQQEAARVNSFVASNHVAVSITPETAVMEAEEGLVNFEADLRGGRPPFGLEWDFGDGSRAWGPNPSHRFRGPGKFPVTLSARDSTGRQYSRSAQVCLLGPGTLVEQRDFNSGPPEGFVATSGVWTSINGAYRQTDAMATASHTLLRTSAGPQYTVETDFVATGGRDSLWLIYSGAGSGADLRVEVEPMTDTVFQQEGQTARVWLISDSGRTHRYVPLRRREVRRLAVDVLSDTVLVRLDGRFLMGSRLHRSGGDGVVGLGARGLAGEFDNFRVLARTPLSANPGLVRPDPTGQPNRFVFSPNVHGGLPPLSYAWDFGDGSSSSEAAPQHEYPAQGAYAARLRVTDARGAVRESALTALAGAQVFFREAVDYDWVDSGSLGFPAHASSGQQYGAGRKARRRLDYFQAVRGEGDRSDWRDEGEVSLASDAAVGGIAIGWTSPGDWWNYTFDLAAAGLARVRAQVSAERPASIRVSWQDRFVCDLSVPGKGGSHWLWADSPPFPVERGRGTLRFQVLEGSTGGSINLARFELERVDGPDMDGDGIANLADVDRDGDGYSDADEATERQSDPGSAASTPPDADGDRISNANDGDDDGDGTPDDHDPLPLVANRAPVFPEIPDQVVRAGEPVNLMVEATDADVPVQNLTYGIAGDIPPGMTLSPDGRLSWIPDRGLENRLFTVTITVHDDGSPPLRTEGVVRWRVDPALESGFEVVTVETTGEPTTFVVPRRKFSFEATNRTLYLATTGDDANLGTLEKPWRTFTHAVGNLDAGDVLYVRRGEYAEAFNVRAYGRPGRPIVISAFPGERVRIVEPEGWRASTPHGGIVQMTECAWVWLHGFEIIGTWRYGSAYVPGHDRFGIQLGGEANQLLNNIIGRAYDSGIRVQWGNCLVEGNVVFECGTPWEGRGMDVMGNPGERSVVRGNVTLRCSGIQPGYIHGGYFYNNLMVDSSALGFSLGPASGVIGAHNVISGSGFTGFGLGDESRSNRVVNNILVDSAPRHLHYFGRPESPSFGNVFDYNLLGTESAFAEPAAWFSAWVGLHLLHVDPQFQNAEGGDFRLLPESKARNAAGEVKLLGALRSPDLGVFPASQYWLPAIAPLAETTIPEGEESRIALTLAVANPDVATLRFEWMEPPPLGLMLDSAGRALVWKPTELQGPGEYTLRLLTVADESPLVSTVSTLKIRVREVNAPPATTAIPNQTVAEGQTLRLDLGLPDVGNTPGILRQLYGPVDGVTVADLTDSTQFPDRPSSATIRASFEAPRDAGDSYGQRMRGFVVPPQTGNYTFWIASDDASVLKLSPNALPAGASTIASVLSWTDFRQWTKEPNQKSASVWLETGKPYYIEALMKEGGGGDHLSVRWQLPTGDIQTPIPQASLRAWVNEPTFFAIDLDAPAQTLTYRLAPDAPAGASIDPATGLLLWNPGEDQGPGDHRITVRVTDNADPPLSSEQTFTVSVNEMNSAPVMTAMDPQAAAEGEAFRLVPSASDADLPADTLTWSLGADSPAGMSIDPTTGVIAWNPHETQGGQTFVVTVTVTDNGLPPSSASGTFTATVAEANTPPTLAAIGDRTVEIGSQLRLTVTATDTDLPVNSLTFALGSEAPDGAQITPAGAFEWSPVESQGGANYTIPITVTDDGTPPLTDTTMLRVTVAEAQHEIRLSGITLSANGRFSFSWTPRAGRTYLVQSKAALDESEWMDVQTTLVTAGGVNTCTVPVTEAAQRYYRVLQKP